MIKVFLAESYKTVLDKAKEDTAWENEGYILAGAAGSGEEAYAKILEEKPDIVITNIDLPVIGGFELIRMIKEACPDIKVIILSEHESFDYVRQAIALGVSDYLLKPVSAEALFESLNKIKAVIYDEKSRSNSEKKGGTLESDETALKKFSLLNDLIQGEITPEEADRRSDEIGIQLGAGIYRVMIFKVWCRHEEHGTEEQTEEISRRIESCAENVFGDKAICFRNGSDRRFILMKAESEEEIRDKTLSLKKNLEKVMENYPFIDYFAGIGESADEISKFKNAFETAEKLFSMRFIQEPRHVLTEEEMSTVNDGAFSADNLDKLEYSRMLVEKFLVEGVQDEIDSFIDFYLSKIPEENFQSLLMRQYLAVDIFIIINVFYKKNGIDRKNANSEEDFAKRIRNIHTADQMGEVLREVLAETLKRRDEISGNKYTQLIERAQKYVEEHYMSEHIALNAVAEYVNMNPSYFSFVFRKETGLTFVEYVTRVRLERAKELLLCSSLKISEIAYKVGYNDPQYFSYLFKKYNQCSPKEYRQKEKPV